MTVTDGFTTVTDAEAADDAAWDDIGSGPGSSQDDNSPIEGSANRGRRGDNAQKGMSFDNATGIDVSATGVHLVYWARVFQPGLINTNGLLFIAGGGSTPSTSPWSGWRFQAADYPETGPWIIVAVDPTATRTTGAGTLSLSSVRQYGCDFDMGNVGGTSPNIHLDSIRYGDVAYTITGGTSSVPTTWSDVITQDSTDAQGMVNDDFLNGPIEIGGANTYFQSEGVVLKAGNQPLAANDWIRVDLLNSSATNEIFFNLTDSFTGIHFTVTGTSGTIDLSGATILSAPLAISLNSAVTWSGSYIGSPTLTPSGATLTNMLIANTTGSYAVDISTAADLADITDCRFVDNNDGDIGHSVRSTATGTHTWDGNTLSGGGPEKREFDTETDVASNIVTTDAAHGYSSGDAVYYDDRGGAESIGLTDLTQYWVNAQSTTTLSFHNSQSDANSDTNRVTLTASGAGNGETHFIYSAKADFFNDSGGAITINVINDGGSPTYRNGSNAATTTVNNSVTYTLTGLDNDSVVVIVDTPGGARNILTSGNPTSNTFTYTYNYTVDTAIDVMIFDLDKRQVSFEDTLTNSNKSIPVTQASDPVYSNP